MCKGSWGGGGSGPAYLPEAYRRHIEEEYQSLVPPPPWIMRGENALWTFGVLVMILLGAIIARIQWGV